MHVYVRVRVRVRVRVHVHVRAHVCGAGLRRDGKEVGWHVGPTRTKALDWANLPRVYAYVCVRAGTANTRICAQDATHTHVRMCEHTGTPKCTS